MRFGGLTVVLAVAAGVLWRRDARRARAFGLGLAVALGCLSLYAYRITGSVLPTALWYADGGGTVLSLARPLRQTLAYLVDRDWGLLPHAPIYLLALPGYWWTFRRRPDAAWLCVLLPLALVLPAAGHTLIAAGTTPIRLIAAVVPLAAVPLAELLARRGDRPGLRAVVVLLLVVSLHNAFAYNFHHQKHYGLLVDWSFSGWKTNLLFPVDSRSAWEVSSANGWLFAAWIVTLVALAAIPYVLVRAWYREANGRERPGGPTSAITCSDGGEEGRSLEEVRSRIFEEAAARAPNEPQEQ